ncbi:MAG: N-acetyltransferase [Spirochaetales bacterium]|nr:N-acetyltransferase [Spirochaetales bacterium]
MNFVEYKSDNIEKIQQLFIKTFTYSEGDNEGKIIGDLVLDLINLTQKRELFVYVAEKDENIIGCIIFSRLKFENSNVKAFLLSPVAVLTEYQGNGVGQKLISWAHNQLKEKGIEMVFTYGDINFYSKVGYKIIKESFIKAPLPLSYPDGWLAQSLTEKDLLSISGDSFCVEALNKAEYW